MASQEISHANLLSPGADLWVVPERKNSLLAQKLDWYLNFQIAKSAQHQSRPLPQRVTEILKKCALQNYDWIEQSKDSLMVLSNHVFPNRWVLVVRGSDDITAWLGDIFERWQKLNFPTLRIFLPKEASRGDFEKVSKKWEFADRVSFVVEGSLDG